jgi:hypothetical protein
MAHDPFADALKFARALSGSDRVEQLSAYLELLQKAVDSLTTLQHAWQMEEAVFSGDRATNGTADAGPIRLVRVQEIPEHRPPEHAGFDRLRNLVRREPSVRKAALGVILYLGPRRARDICEFLERAGFKKKNLGDQVRSALWHARADGIVSERDGVQGFASEEQRERFEREEIAVTS